MSVQFYDIKNKRKVSIPEHEIEKRTVRTKSGTRYQLVGLTRDNRFVYRFISQADYKSSNYPIHR